LIIVGCTSYFFDSSAVVNSSRIASKATLALNSVSVSSPPPSDRIFDLPFG
jgi:hypothetical protein